jgi:hypothetical protein
LSGNRSGISANLAAVNFLHSEFPGPLPETEIKSFWDLEAIGVKAHQNREWNSKDLNVTEPFTAPSEQRAIGE